MFLFLKNKIICIIVSIAFITVAWAKTIQPEKGLNQAKIAYQTPESFQGRLLLSGIKTNRGLSLAGKASWYSFESCRKEGTNGYYTASGKRFNENDYTCAIWDKKFGTVLKVTNLKSGASVLVMVTDRGPAKRLVRQGRIIDLSKAAFAKIADLRKGIIKIKVEEVCLRK
jgi:rare lipoprotein A